MKYSYLLTYFSPVLHCFTLLKTSEAPLGFRMFSGGGGGYSKVAHTRKKKTWKIRKFQKNPWNASDGGYPADHPQWLP